PLGSHKECLGCRACENVCPTGVIRFSLQDGVIKNDLWDITVDMAVCPICSRSYVTVPLIDRVKTELEALSETISMCPACRRAEPLKRICV
ncbi:MAG: 4Fe-4S binding protein, partial [Desulfatiglandales bacterium]